MCLIVFAWRARAHLDLVVAANRDEFYARPTAPMAFWQNAPEVLAGRDLEAGGTWMGVTRNGRFAAITNFRDPSNALADGPSRGHLVADYLAGAEQPGEYLHRISASGQCYNGYNLLVGDRCALWYYSNRGADPRPLAAGVYGISNHLLDTPWPKVEIGKRRLQEALGSGEHLIGQLLRALSDHSQASDEALPDTGVGLALERTLSPLFIVGDRYGTRASTVLTMTPDGRAELAETTFDRTRPPKTRRFEIELPLEPRVVDQSAEGT